MNKNNHNLLFISLLVFLVGSPQFLLADFDKQINHFFDQFNVVSNNTDPSLFHSQAGVHFLGGQGSVRSKVYDVNPLHIQMPSFSAGCGGIDYTLGGINIASKDEMKKALKSIASNSIGYAFLLGIETVSPVISSTMKQIQSWANQLNAININSCEIGSTIVQGVWPKTQRASAYICEHASTTNSLFTDHIQAKHGCRDDKSKRTEAIKKVQANNKDILVGNYNIAWKLLENMKDLDDETKNLFMNLTGTIVVHEDGNEQKRVTIFPPKYEKTVEVLTFGGEIKAAYKIDKTNHIDVKTSDSIVISPQNAWKNKIHLVLISIRDKLSQERSDSTLAWDTQEMELIRNTHFPISSLITLMTQNNGKAGILSIDLYSTLIAYERVIFFAEDVVKSVLAKAESLRGVQVDGAELEAYINKVQAILSELHQLNQENTKKILEQQNVISFLLKYEKNIREKERGL